MFRIVRILVALPLLFVLFSPASAQKPPAKQPPVQQSTVSVETLELIGGLTANVLTSSNMNIGLAMELLKTKALDAKFVQAIMKQTGAQASVCITQLEAFSKKTKLTKEDRKFLNLLLDGLKGVVGQTAAAREMLQKGDKSFVEKYNKHRKDTMAIIKRIIEE